MEPLDVQRMQDELFSWFLMHCYQTAVMGLYLTSKVM